MVGAQRSQRSPAQSKPGQGGAPPGLGTDRAMLRFFFSTSAMAWHRSDMEGEQTVYHERIKKGSMACAPASLI